MFFLLMAACGASEDYLDFDTGAVESVQCTHPVSVYEAQIKASILPVKDDWDAIEFIVSQDGEHWLTHLRKPDDDGTWSQAYPFISTIVVKVGSLKALVMICNHGIILERSWQINETGQHVSNGWQPDQHDHHPRIALDPVRGTVGGSGIVHDDQNRCSTNQLGRSPPKNSGPRPILQNENKCAPAIHDRRRTTRVLPT